MYIQNLDYLHDEFIPQINQYAEEGITRMLVQHYNHDIVAHYVQVVTFHFCRPPYQWSNRYLFLRISDVFKRQTCLNNKMLTYSAVKSHSDQS